MPWRRTLLALAGGLGGLLLCSIFILPLLAEGRYLQQQVYVTDTYDFRNHFVQIGQYFSPFWGFGFSDDPQGANDGMSFQVGVLLLVLAVGAVFGWRRARVARAIQGYLLVMGALLLVVMTPLAQPLWEALPPLAVIQFPWRLLALTGFLFSALGGLLLANLALDDLADEVQALLATATGASRSPAGGLLVFALLGVFASWPYLQANLSPVEDWREDGRAIFRFEQEHPDMIAYTEWVTQPFSTTVMSAGYAAPDYAEDHGYTTSLDRLQIVAGDGTVTSRHSRGSSGGGVVDMAAPGVVQVNFFYFPGWEVTVDGLPAQTRPSPTGAILVDVGVGRHAIDARFGDTPPRTLGALISGVMLIVAAGLLSGAASRMKGQQLMRILAIETSCDETAAAVIEDGRHVLSNVVATQIELHRRFGGVFPEVASRQHVLAIEPVIAQALAEAGVNHPSELDAIAVTHGPGLAGSLLVGVNAAKGLAFAGGLPLLPINHLEGHVYSNWLDTGAAGPTARAGDRLSCLGVDRLRRPHRAGADAAARALRAAGRHA